MNNLKRKFPEFTLNDIKEFKSIIKDIMKKKNEIDDNLMNKKITIENSKEKEQAKKITIEKSREQEKSKDLENFSTEESKPVIFSDLDITNVSLSQSNARLDEESYNKSCNNSNSYNSYKRKK